jgi:hypothetical protein
MHVVSPGDGPFSGPAYLTTLLACSHKVISWLHSGQALEERKSSRPRSQRPKLDGDSSRNQSAPLTKQDRIRHVEIYEHRRRW